MRIFARICFLAAAAVGGLALASSALAANRTWVGGSNNWDATTGNWSGNDEPDADDAAIFNGNVSVNLANANESINGLTMSGGADLNLNGNDLIVNGPATLSGSSTFLFVGPGGSVFSPDSVTVNSGAVLGVRGGTMTINEESGDGQLDINAGGSVNGSGIISFSDAVLPGISVLHNEGSLDATFAFPIDVDGSGAGTLSIIASDADARLDLDGTDVAGGGNGDISVGRNDTLDINVPLADHFDGTLTLRAGATLDVSHDWIFRGNLDVNTEGLAPGTAGAAATIAGGQFTVMGVGGLFDASISIGPIDTLRIASACHFGGGGNVRLNIVGGTLILDGGGVIGGPISLFFADGGVIRGFGLIDVPVLGVVDAGDLGDEKLLADNGALELGNIFSNVIVGTADADGILRVLDPWNTSAAVAVTLAGGELAGATITNDLADGIRGHGLITARVNNESEIRAEGGGTLVLDATGGGNSWDGASSMGGLVAATADLELRDNALHPFHGYFSVFAGQEVFTNGFGFLFQSTSNVFLHGGGRYRSTHQILFGGALLVSAGEATLQVDDLAGFSSLCQATLAGDLLLDNETTRIEVGAQFIGGGALINAVGRTLELEDGVTGADLAVTVVNNGVLAIEQLLMDGSPAQVQGVDYEQTSSGVWKLDVGGVGLTAFDRFMLTGAAVLDGTLELSLAGGFVPTLGNSFSILSAAGGVNGSFDAITQPADMPIGLAFSVAYNPTLVQLQVVSVPTFPADFDHDGDVDGDDLVQWQGDFGLNGESDSDSDGDSDGADFLAWQQQLGSVPATAAANAVPEPRALLVMGACGALMPALARRRRFAPAC